MRINSEIRKCIIYLFMSILFFVIGLLFISFGTSRSRHISRILSIFEMFSLLGAIYYFVMSIPEIVIKIKHKVTGKPVEAQENTKLYGALNPLYIFLRLAQFSLVLNIIFVLIKLFVPLPDHLANRVAVGPENIIQLFFALVFIWSYYVRPIMALDILLSFWIIEFPLQWVLQKLGYLPIIREPATDFMLLTAALAVIAYLLSIRKKYLTFIKDHVKEKTELRDLIE